MKYLGENTFPSSARHKGGKKKELNFSLLSIYQAVLSFFSIMRLHCFSTVPWGALFKPDGQQHFQRSSVAQELAS